jgi:ABC-2 type transport system ATP-binding protein
LRGGSAVLVSTPYMDEAMRFNRVIFMNHGKVLTQGAPRELMKRLEGRILELDTDDQMKARQIAVDDPEVEDVHTFGNHLHLRVSHAQGPMERIPTHLESAGIPMNHLIHVPATLEDVFIHLIETEGAEYGTERSA